jgi:putative ABC transport system permease protein
MSLLAALRHRLRTLLRPRTYARELREEIDFHLSLDAMDQAAGRDALVADEAPYAAKRRFGNVTRYTEETREMSGLGFFDMFRQDARFALRTFRHSPTFTAVAVATIALGIGATAAIFSVVDGLILKPLPYPDAEHIVQVWMDNRRLKLAEDVHSIPNLMDLKAQNQTLAHLGPYVPSGANLTGAGEPQRIAVGVMSADALAALGMRPTIGQLFNEEAERAGNDAVVLISTQLWKANFGSDPSVIGRELEMNGRKRRVIGVMPASFAFPSPETQAWTPLVLSDGARNARSSFGYFAIGSLKPGVSVERARADLGAIAKRLEDQYPSNKDYGVTVTPLPEQIVGPTLRTTLWLMLGAVAAVLLIACANVANLLLSRAAVREREVTVRMALGASNRRLVRQMITESLLLSLLGGVVGVGLAFAALRVLPALAPTDLPRISNVEINGTVLVVTTLVTVVTGLLFGLVPAVQSSRTQLSETLREGGRGGTSGRGGQRLRRVIVGAQLALVVVLLTGAGLLLRTFVGLQRTQLGFETKNVVTMNIVLPRAKYAQGPQMTAFFDGLLARLHQIPGVRNASTVSTMMLSTLPFSGFMSAEGREFKQDDQEVTFDAASPGFFATIGARLIAGRDFGSQDQGGAGGQVVIVNEHMAKRYWPDRSAIGGRLRFGRGLSDDSRDTTQNPWITVVGVVADMRRTGVDMPVRDEAFFPYAQGPSSSALVMIRTAGDPMAMGPQFRQAVREIDRDQAVGSIRTMDQILSGLIAQRRFSMVLVGAFAILAMALALIGAYGVTSYLVSQRSREIGVRLALGADPSRITRLVVRDGMVVAGTGVAIGVAGAIATSRLASSLLYGVSARDPITIASVATALLIVSAFANYIPARRASRVDPLLALRQD